MNDNNLKTLQQLHFDNRFTDELPSDPIVENYRRAVKNACFSFVEPTAVEKPQLVACSEDMLHELGLDQSVCDEQEFVQAFSGNKPLSGMRPYAMCYGGHQFGNWAGQLGDGRAILLGDVIHNSKRWSLQLKGAGPTPYSRTADGLAVLRSSLREFICSEAMYHLGIPTTRALSLILTGEPVLRDMFYDGHPQHEPGAVVCRVAPSFTRFGNFQILSAQKDFGTLKQLVDYTIKTDFPHLDAPSKAVYIQWFEEVCQRTAEMIVHWMRVGFVHGVMNTDNMSILGLTIDYGPYGWLENYDPDWTPNTTDANGRRYRYGSQAQIAQWNLLQLAEAIYPLIEDVKPLEKALLQYHEEYQNLSQRMHANKLGFSSSTPAVDKLSQDLEQLLTMRETDMTLFYRSLSKVDFLRDASLQPETLRGVFECAWYQSESIDEPYLSKLGSWLQRYRDAIDSHNISETVRGDTMNRTNPRYVFRNYIAQLAIDRVEQGDFSAVTELLEVFKKPYHEQPEFEQYAARRPEWARHRAGCSMLSCSS